MAYGQTGTGKTHTILGKRDGLLPKCMQFMFDKGSQGAYVFELSCLQIYMEKLTDLFDPQNQNLELRETSSGFNVSNSKWIRLRNLDDSLRIIEYAESRRLSHSTYMNPFSSRSHAIFIVRVINSKTMTSSCLFLVDLAGSERIKKSQAQGDRLEEAISINRSLMALGKCIYGISENKSQHIPFRESKLTKLLQDTLTGNSKSAIIITISPDAPDVEESMSSLKFGQRAAKVYCAPKICKIQENEATLHMDYLNDELTHLYRDNEALKAENKLLVERLESVDKCEAQEEMQKNLTVHPQDSAGRNPNHSFREGLYGGDSQATDENLDSGYSADCSNGNFAISEMRAGRERGVLRNIENEMNGDMETYGPVRSKMIALEKENRQLKAKIDSIEMETFDQLKNTFDTVEDKFYLEVDNLKTANSKLQLNIYKNENELCKLKSGFEKKSKRNDELEAQVNSAYYLNSISGGEWSELCEELYEKVANSKQQFYQTHQTGAGREAFDLAYGGLYDGIKGVINKLNKLNSNVAKNGVPTQAGLERAWRSNRTKS
jgi:hypothetical protein